MHARLAMPLMALTQMRGEGCALLHAEGGVKGARGGAWSGEGAAGATGMVGGGRHHTLPPSEDVCRGRPTHTLPPFCPSSYHTLPPKNPEPGRRHAGGGRAKFAPIFQDRISLQVLLQPIFKPKTCTYKVQEREYRGPRLGCSRAPTELSRRSYVGSCWNQLSCISCSLTRCR